MKNSEQPGDEADNTFAYIMAKAKDYGKHIGGPIYKGKHETEQEIEEIRRMLEC